MNKFIRIDYQADPWSAGWDMFFEAGAIGIHLMAANGTILRANRTELDLLDYAREEYEGQHFAKFCDKPEVAANLLDRLSKGETLERFPAYLRTKGGSLKHVQVSSKGRFEDGKLIDACCFLVDVTGVQRVEQPSQENYRQLLEALPAAVYMTDAQGRITYYNQTAADLVGRRPEIGKDEWCVTWKLYQPDGTPLPHDQCPMATAIKEQRPVRGAEAILERPDGTRASFLPYPTPLYDPETGELTGAVNLLVDISELKQAEATRELLINELHHRIKNALANVQALAQHTLRRNVAPAEFVASFSSRIQALARAHALLTNECWQGVDLKTLVLDQLHANPDGEDQLSIYGPQLKLEPEMALHIAMLLNELQANATKHGAFAARQGKVSVGWSVRDWMLHLRWLERGGPVVRMPAKRGFGTMLIEQSAKAYNGEAHMSCETHGVMWNISFALPRSPRNNEVFMPRGAAYLRERGGPSEKSDAMSVLAGKRVLIVEDEPLIALEQAANVEDLGMEPVGPAGAVEEALRLIASQSLDAALLDGNLSGHPVDEIAAALTRRGVPFAFVTGYSRSSLPQAFRSAPLIVKPMTLAALLETMRRLLLNDGQAVPLRSKPAR